MTFTLTRRSLASFDTVSSSWMAEAGEYKILAGASSKDIRQSDVFSLNKDIMVKRISRALVPSMEINKIKP